MKNRHLMLALVLSIGLTACATTSEIGPTAPTIAPTTAPTFDPSRLVGIWQGAIKAGGQELRLVFNLSYEDGTWSATVDSPDQGVEGIPVESVTVEGREIVLKIPAAAASYTGTVHDEIDFIEGNWSQGAGRYTVDLRRIDKVEKITRPQDPVRPYPYDEREVRFFNEEAGITLAGTFTIPRQGGPFPGVVLISGSGAQNRDEEIMNHRPFLVLSDYLTRAGIAVLRYDDRGVGESEGDAATASSADLAGDALSAHRYLAAQPGVNPSLVGLVGHSEGGLIAPMIAAENPSVGFLVLLAGPGFRGYDVLLQQSAAILKASGATEEQITMIALANRKIYDVVESEPDDQKAGAQIRQILADLGTQEAEIDAQIASILSPWFRFFISYDPREALGNTTVPVLAMNGSLDVQIIADENLAAISAALTAGGNDQVTIAKMEGLNHLFQHATTGLVLEYGQIEETFAPEALKQIADWILEVASGG